MNDAKDEQVLLKIEDVARLTGLSVGTLYHWVSQRRIPFVRLSPRSIRFRRSDLEHWLDGMHHPARDETTPKGGKRVSLVLPGP